MRDRDRAPIAFLDKTFEETLALAVETEGYMRSALKREARRLAPGGRLRLNLEGMRLVSRIAHVVAWLLDQRAVRDGELTRAELCGRSAPMSDNAVCLAHDSTLAGYFPPRFAILLERSQKLYLRVARLDDLMRRTAG